MYIANVNLGKRKYFLFIVLEWRNVTYSFSFFSSSPIIQLCEPHFFPYFFVHFDVWIIPFVVSILIAFKSLNLGHVYLLLGFSKLPFLQLLGSCNEGLRPFI